MNPASVAHEFERECEIVVTAPHRARQGSLPPVTFLQRLADDTDALGCQLSIRVKRGVEAVGEILVKLLHGGDNIFIVGRFESESVVSLPLGDFGKIAENVAQSRGVQVNRSAKNDLVVDENVFAINPGPIAADADDNSPVPHRQDAVNDGAGR